MLEKRKLKRKLDWYSIGLLAIILFGILAQASQAKTAILTPDLHLDSSYTLKYPFAFKDGIISIGKDIKITPSISVAGQKLNLTASALQSAVTTIDFSNKRKWSISLSNPLSLNLDYISFDISGCKKYSEFVMHCGQVEIDFSDLADAGYYVDILSDTFLSVTNPTLLSKSAISLDPTDRLLPNATNKAYIISSTATDNPNIATAEFSSAQYASINVSDNSYTTSTAQKSITYAGCTMSDNNYACKTDGETCTGNTCRFASICASDTCNIGSCSAITHATGSSESCWLTPTTGASCGCFEGGCTGKLPTCSGSSGTCTISGNCDYTCESTWYDCDATADCETQTPCYLYGFQRYTFNLSAYDWGTVTQLDFCFEGKYASTGGTASANLQWYNVTASAWVNTTAISTTEGTVCLNFSGANLTDVYNSTGTWVEFAARGNQSKTGHTLTLSGDYAYLNVTYTAGGAVTPEGDSFTCKIPSYWGGVASMPILCSIHSNTTGQPVTGATVTCTVHSSPYFASASQTVQTCSEQGNSMYNCTFLSGNQAVNTPYIINCSASVNGVVNWDMGVTYISQAYTTSCASTTDVQNGTSAILGNMSNNFTNTNNLITYLNGNMSNNFTYTNGQITLVLGNQTLILGNQTLILGNQTLILNNIILVQNNQTYTLNNITLVLNNHTLILGNISAMNNNMDANFTATNDLINNLDLTCDYTINITANNTYGTNETYNYTMPFNLTKEQADMIAHSDWQMQYEMELRGYESTIASEQKKALYISVVILILVVLISGYLVYYMVKRRRR